jgi:hypothetical protein
MREEDLLGRYRRIGIICWTLSIRLRVVKVRIYEHLIVRARLPPYWKSMHIWQQRESGTLPFRMRRPFEVVCTSPLF